MILIRKFDEAIKEGLEDARRMIKWLAREMSKMLGPQMGKIEDWKVRVMNDTNLIDSEWTYEGHRLIRRKKRDTVNRDRRSKKEGKLRTKWLMD